MSAHAPETIETIETIEPLRTKSDSTAFEIGFVANLNKDSNVSENKTSFQEAVVARTEDDVVAAKHKLSFYKSLVSPTDKPMSITIEYKELFSNRAFGHVQVSFLRTCFAPTFTNNTQSLDQFIAKWEKAAPFYAVPDNILSIRPINDHHTELRVQLESPITRPLLAAIFPSVLDEEDDATVDCLVRAHITMHHVLTRNLFFGTDAHGECIVTHSLVSDDRYVQMASFVAAARKEADATRCVRVV
ncbi:Aste57867_16711 [Aphanomyces stellatus]|uniref:Aste57867_16711 protein n=1 Tax=Aphanomyces stellatus TaxID=120398 RepID=A0A485L723_9STRA|nr:hypothetical protein As57867_016654 [Aphanomyces stellatus]VFT93481.1 Aste57867_16711 [Aphanomyces stellatus]